MVIGSLAAAAHGTALVVYLHFFGKVIHLLSFKGNTQNSDALFQYALYIIYIAVAVFAAAWIEVSCWILTGERQTAVIRSKYVQVLLNQDMSFFDTYGNNVDIVSQVLSDVLLIQSAISEKPPPTGPFIVAAGGISNIFLHRLAVNIQDAYAEAASIAEQAISYVRALYAFTNETLAKYSYATSLQATLRYGILISLVQGLGLGFTYGLAICSCALQLWVGRFLLKSHNKQGDQILIALFSVILSGLGLNQAATNFYAFEQGRIAAYRLYEMISRSTSSANQEGNTLASLQGTIEFRNVYFSFLSRPEIPIPSEFFLTVPASKPVALVGRNGSGKSSIISLMERFYDPTLGEVLLDGENMKNLKVEWLRSQIGLVTQEPALLSLSIRYNIAYGRSGATFDEIEEAAKIAHAHSFISSLEQGYKTQVGRAGLTLTEEQKIKLSVARAVLSNLSILLLDEITGGLDFEAEKAVQEALDVLMLGRSTMIILSWRKGQLVEMGTHDELLTLNGLYTELLRCEEAAKLPNRTPMRSRETTASQNEKDISSDHITQESSSPRMSKSPSLQRAHGAHAFWASDATFNSQELPKLQSPPLEQVSENGMPLASTDEAESVKGKTSTTQLSFDGDIPVKQKYVKDTQLQKPPSLGRFAELSFPEWIFALLGSSGAAIFESHHQRYEVGKWCLFIVGTGIVTVVANFLQHFYFGILEEKITERVRRMMFSVSFMCFLGNSADNLSMRLANDATFVCAAFSNRLSIFIQDSTAVAVALLIGMLLEWRVSLVALATQPVLVISAIAQKLWLAGFSRGIQEMHRKASLVLEDSVRNIYTVVAFCAGNKVMELYRLQLVKIFKQSFLHGMAIGFAFGFSQFLLFACNALLLWYTPISVKNGHLDLPTGAGCQMQLQHHVADV
ncbi:hypothetical protein MKX03_012174 [Papaver bracteatum]|nr:hypothetical protein MKX03_012174 [Papaver bracteatum]